MHPRTTTHMRAYLSAQSIPGMTLPFSRRLGKLYFVFNHIFPLLSFSHSARETVHFAPCGLTGALATRAREEGTHSPSIRFDILKHELNELNVSRFVPARPVVYLS